MTVLITTAATLAKHMDLSGRAVRGGLNPNALTICMAKNVNALIRDVGGTKQKKEYTEGNTQQILFALVPLKCLPWMPYWFEQYVE